MLIKTVYRHTRRGTVGNNLIQFPGAGLGTVEVRELEYGGVPDWFGLAYLAWMNHRSTCDRLDLESCADLFGDKAVALSRDPDLIHDGMVEFRGALIDDDLMTVVRGAAYDGAGRTTASFRKGWRRGLNGTALLCIMPFDNLNLTVVLAEWMNGR